MRNINGICERVAGQPRNRVRTLAMVREGRLELVKAGWFPCVGSGHGVVSRQEQTDSYSWTTMGVRRARQVTCTADGGADGTYRLRNMMFADRRLVAERRGLLDAHREVKEVEGRRLYSSVGQCEWD